MQLVGTKEKFLEYIARQIEEGDIIVLSNELSGNLQFSEKKKLTKIQFGFSQSSFKEKGIGHIAFGETIPVAIFICKRDVISESALEKL